MPVRHDCNICQSKCTKSQLASCLFCEYHVCKSCARQWLLSLNEDPTCMNCHRPFNHDAMTQLFGASFVKSEWKRHRESVLLDRETAMLAETQPYVDQELQDRENKKRIIELEQEKERMKRQMREIDRTIHDISNTRVEVQTDRREFIQRCAGDGCDGFLTHNWKCRKCGFDTCKDCGAFKGENPELHVCKDEDKASMKLIREDSRRCVKCGAWTYKIHGCNQMYCVAPGCNTAWDWRTGKVVTGVIHNPEYFRMRRELNILHRDLNDIPCGGAPSLQEILAKWRGDSIEYSILTGYLRLLQHVSVEELPRYPDRPLAQDNRDLRIRFFLSELEADDMKTKLQQREKKANKQRDIHMLLTMLVTTMSDLMRQIVVDPSSFYANHTNVKNLITYYNRELAKICYRYQCVGPSVYTNNIEGGYWRIRNTNNPITIFPTPRPAPAVQTS